MRCHGICDWMNGWMNAWIHEWTSEWMNECMNEWMNERANEWMNVWMHEWMNERMNEWMNEWMNECMNEWMNEWIPRINPIITGVYSETNEETDEGNMFIYFFFALKQKPKTQLIPGKIDENRQQNNSSRKEILILNTLKMYKKSLQTFEILSQDCALFSFSLEKKTKNKRTWSRYQNV